VKVGVVADYAIGYNFSGMYLQLLRVLEGTRKLGVDASLYDMWHCADAAYDLLHFYGINYSLSHLAAIATSLHIPYVVSPNTWPGYNWLIQRFLAHIRLPKHILVSRRALEREILLRARGIIVNSTAELRRLSKVYGIGKDLFRVIPNGIESQFRAGDPDLFKAKFGLTSRFVLTVGQFGQPGKNHLRLLQAWDSGMPMLVMVGSAAPGPYAERCKKLMTQLSNVVWVGPIPHDSDLLRSAYKGCSAFVLPSIAETTGLSALEAAVSGAPVVVTERGGTKDYFEDKAFYCDPFNPKSIRYAVEKALAAGRDESRGEYFASKYNWETVSRMVMEMYENAVQ